MPRIPAIPERPCRGIWRFRSDHAEDSDDPERPCRGSQRFRSIWSVHAKDSSDSGGSGALMTPRDAIFDDFDWTGPVRPTMAHRDRARSLWILLEYSRRMLGSCSRLRCHMASLIGRFWTSEAGCAFTKRHSSSLVRLCMQGLSSCNLHDGALVDINTINITSINSY